MHIKRSLVSVVAVLAGALAAVSAAGPAQAAAPAHHGATVRVLTAPPAPSGAQAASARTASASAPTISPSVSTEHVASGGSYFCPSGTLCAAAWDPTTSNYKVFHMAICAKYALSYWSGTGSYFDNQTGGVTSYFYGESGNTLKSFKPDATNHTYSWNSVWSIRNCS